MDNLRVHKQIDEILKVDHPEHTQSPMVCSQCVRQEKILALVDEILTENPRRIVMTERKDERDEKQDERKAERDAKQAERQAERKEDRPHPEPPIAPTVPPGSTELPAPAEPELNDPQLNDPLK